jgi:hypothetical protein
MTSIFVGMQTDQIHKMIETVDSLAEVKLQEVLKETIETAKKTVGLKGHIGDPYNVAYEIAMAAFNGLEQWAAYTFTDSPFKETATAWVRGCSYRFDGPRSIQSEIRQILSQEEKK